MTENFLYPEQFSHAHFQSISYPDSQPQGSHWSALCHYHVAFIRLSSISGIRHVAFVFDCFQVQYHLWDYSCCICSLWLYCWVLFHNMIIPQFICSLTDGYLSCLKFLTIRPTINTAVQIFVWICFQSS